MRVDLEDSLFDSEIWPVPIKKPFTNTLGLYFQYIPLDQIPFDHSVLTMNESIYNDTDDQLLFRGEGYLLVTDNPNEFLSNWFTKWEIREVITTESKRHRIK